MLRALKLGDMLTAVPALRALAAAFPDHRRVLAAPGWLAPLALHAGTADEVADTPSLDHLDPALRGADVAVNLHGRGPQSTALLRESRPRRLIAFDSGDDAPTWRAGEHEVSRWCRLLQECGVAADPCDLSIDAPPVAAAPGAEGATIIHPGAAEPARRWPPERWGQVARAEAAAGRRVLITGSTAEMALGHAVATLAGLSPGSVLAGQTPLLELVATVARAGRVVCGDTGVAHVATAVGTPSVVLFGPVPPSAWGPPPLDRHIALWAGRTGDPHGHLADPGLLALSVDDVLAAVQRLPVRS